MKKIIRLSESELVSLVKRTIMEDNEDSISTQSDILTYQGTNKDLLKLQNILRVGELTPEQLTLAKEILVKEYFDNIYLVDKTIIYYNATLSKEDAKKQLAFVDFLKNV